MRNTLRRVTAYVAKAEKYHETITLFWVHLLAEMRAVNSEQSLEQIVQAYPRLLEKSLPLGYLSPQRLFSEAA